MSLTLSTRRIEHTVKIKLPLLLADVLLLKYIKWNLEALKKNKWK